ncbi:unnamed protein product [Vitrella brassicaformis CCMP3155]|uniref:Uncharacterized protein n=1 Tax=Vitrella brassicaformis (strain CCMP3155) TaxID=1169540 RepID=A0A0G4EG28_VITBC|nr:unnamed protein product [Vitrella brassicaformis CCMP3155]|eukprot:CEL94440.1 unnamed protein product [Vitrella brassicaformis CCMP3155]
MILSSSFPPFLRPTRRALLSLRSLFVLNCLRLGLFGVLGVAGAVVFSKYGGITGYDDLRADERWEHRFSFLRLSAFLWLPAALGCFNATLGLYGSYYRHKCVTMADSFVGMPVSCVVLFCAIVSHYLGDSFHAFLRIIAGISRPNALEAESADWWHRSVCETWLFAIIMLWTCLGVQVAEGIFR